MKRADRDLRLTPRDPGPEPARKQRERSSDDHREAMAHPDEAHDRVDEREERRDPEPVAEPVPVEQGVSARLVGERAVVVGIDACLKKRPEVLMDVPRLQDVVQQTDADAPEDRRYAIQQPGAPGLAEQQLSDGETDELRNAAPQLKALLADNHPARQVARNLFRLSRLANRPSAAPMPRTEVEMAEQWWQTADGPKDAHQRERARVLTALAEQVLSRVERLTVKDLPAPAIDALVISETLRDLGNDHVTFRHDALRDWAIANDCR